MTQVLRSGRTPSLNAEQFAKSCEGRDAVQQGVKAAAAELTRNEGAHPFSNVRSTWEPNAQPNGSFAIQETNAKMNSNVDVVAVGVKGNTVVATGSDVLHYGKDAWSNEVAISGPVNDSSLRRAIWDAVVDTAGRENTPHPSKLEHEILNG